jgi:hypothetical protein
LITIPIQTKLLQYLDALQRKLETPGDALSPCFEARPNSDPFVASDQWFMRDAYVVKSLVSRDTGLRVRTAPHNPTQAQLPARSGN